MARTGEYLAMDHWNTTADITTLGKGFGIKTIYVIALTSVLFEVLPMFPGLHVMMEEKLLVALVGAAMESVGLGLVLLRGGSSGGTDIIAMMINKYWPVSPGRVYLITDLVIISCLLFVPGKGLVDMIYAYVMMLGFSFGVDFVLLGNKSSVQILVFSSKYEEIAGIIRARISDGTYPIDSMLPIQSDLAKEFGVSRMTVKKAIEMLTIEGLIAVISLCATFFSLGYSIGRNSKTQK